MVLKDHGKIMFCFRQNGKSKGKGPRNDGKLSLTDMCMISINVNIFKTFKIKVKTSIDFFSLFTQF